MESTTQPPKDVIIFILGPPGSGKGTNCERAAEILKPGHRCYRHISVGDCLRKLCNPETHCDEKNLDRNMIHNFLRENKLLPANVLIPLLKHTMDSTPTEKGCTTIWLIDGFPRNMETALAFEEKIGKPIKVIALRCHRDKAQDRYLKRCRETIDDKERFNNRYDGYLRNMAAIQKHYESILECISVDGDKQESLRQFMAALPPTSDQ
ncbi:P-loop containing nucleoside triphosphate hydrolase protein [Xylaria sp. FL1042]|nr:P-loop containing nucleoside triphosphate hydrolase protein [Xylaria sp. FL1042]